MRNYQGKKNVELVSVTCNGCGKELKVEKGILKEGCFHGEDAFGYFSSKDGQIYTFDLCEECFDRMAAGFKVPPLVEDETELI